MKGIAALFLLALPLAAQPAPDDAALEAADASVQAFADALAAADDPLAAGPKKKALLDSHQAAERLIAGLGREPAGDAGELKREFELFQTIKTYDQQLAFFQSDDPSSEDARRAAAGVSEWLDRTSAAPPPVTRERKAAFRTALTRLAARVGDLAGRRAAASRASAGPAPAPGASPSPGGGGAPPRPADGGSMFDGSAPRRGPAPAPPPRPAAPSAPAATPPSAAPAPRTEGTPRRAAPRERPAPAPEPGRGPGDHPALGAVEELLPDEIGAELRRREYQSELPEREGARLRLAQVLLGRLGRVDSPEVMRLLTRLGGGSLAEGRRRVDWLETIRQASELARNNTALRHDRAREDGEWLRLMDEAFGRIPADLTEDALPEWSDYREHLDRDASVERRALRGGDVPDGRRYAPSELGLTNLPERAEIVKDTLDGAPGLWTEVPNGPKWFESFDKKVRAQRVAAGGGELETRWNDSLPPGTARRRARTERGGWGPWTLVRALNRDIVESLDEAGKRLLLEADADVLVKTGSEEERRAAAGGLASRFAAAVPLPESADQRSRELLTAWLSDAFDSSVAASLRVFALPDGSFAARYEMKDGSARVETGRFAPSSPLNGKRRGTAFVLTMPQLIDRDGAASGGGAKRYREYLERGKVLQWNELYERRDMGVFRGAADVTDVSLSLLRRDGRQRWIELEKEEKARVVEETGSSGLGLVAHWVGQVPVFKQLMEALAVVGAFAYDGLAGAGQAGVGALNGNARSSLEGDISLHRAAGGGSLDRAACESILTGLSPTERDELQGQAIRLRGDRLIASGLKERMGEAEFLAALNAPVTREEELAAIPTLGAGTYGEQLLSRAAGSSGAASGGLYVAGALMTAGETVGQNVVGAGVLAALAEVRAAAGVVEAVGKVGQVQQGVQNVSDAGRVASSIADGDAAGVARAVGSLVGNNLPEGEKPAERPSGVNLDGPVIAGTPQRPAPRGAPRPEGGNGTPRGSRPPIGAPIDIGDAAAGAAADLARRVTGEEPVVRADPPPPPAPVPAPAAPAPGPRPRLTLGGRTVAHRDNVIDGTFDGRPVVIKLNAGPGEYAAQLAARGAIAGIDNVHVPEAIAGGPTKAFLDKAMAAAPEDGGVFGSITGEVMAVFRPQQTVISERLPDGVVSFKEVLGGSAKIEPIAEADFEKLGEAIVAANMAGAAHGDLGNPSNILLRQVGGRTHFYVIDWSGVRSEVSDMRRIATLAADLRGRRLIAEAPRPAAPPPGPSRGDRARDMRWTADRNPPVAELMRRFMAGTDRVGIAVDNPSLLQAHDVGDCIPRSIYNHPEAAPIREAMTYATFLDLVQRIAERQVFLGRGGSVRNGLNRNQATIILRELGFTSQPAGDILAPEDVARHLGFERAGLQATISWRQPGDAADGYHAVVFEGAFKENGEWRYVVRDSHSERPFLYSWADLQLLQTSFYDVRPSFERGAGGGLDRRSPEALHEHALGLLDEYGLRLDDPLSGAKTDPAIPIPNIPAAPGAETMPRVPPPSGKAVLRLLGEKPLALVKRPAKGVGAVEGRLGDEARPVWIKTYIELESPELRRETLVREMRGARRGGELLRASPYGEVSAMEVLDACRLDAKLSRAFGEPPDLPALISVPSPGKPLWKFTKDGGKLDRAAWDRLRQALVYLGRNGLRHGDMNPGNVIVNEAPDGAQSFTLVDWAGSERADSTTPAMFKAGLDLDLQAFDALTGPGDFRPARPRR